MDTTWKVEYFIVDKAMRTSKKNIATLRDKSKVRLGFDGQNILTTLIAPIMVNKNERTSDVRPRDRAGW